MSNYKVGYKENTIQVMKERNMQLSATFLLPYLKPNMRLLDCGCGPGTITAGFAKLLKKGSVTGIDIKQSQIDIAYKLVKQEHLQNITFQQANLLELPFADDTFDVVFLHSVLPHLNNPQDTIKKLFRIVKPGGMIASRDKISTQLYPEDQLINEYLQERTKLKSHHGIFNLGKQLRSIFLASGCKKVISSASAETPDIKLVVNYYIEDLSNKLWIKAIEQKLLKSRVEEYKKAWNDFAKNPEAFVVWTWGEAIGFKF